jgi:hypothetical protein
MKIFGLVFINIKKFSCFVNYSTTNSTLKHKLHLKIIRCFRQSYLWWWRISIALIKNLSHVFFDFFRIHWSFWFNSVLNVTIEAPQVLGFTLYYQFCTILLSSIISFSLSPSNLLILSSLKHHSSELVVT